MAKRSQDFSSTALPVLFGHPIALNLPRFYRRAVTVLLIYGIRESATHQHDVVIIKVAVVVFVIAFGSFMVQPGKLASLHAERISGVMSGAAIVFFAFIGFDAVSTTAEETKNPQRDIADRHDRQPDHLHACFTC